MSELKNDLGEEEQNLAVVKDHAQATLPVPIIVGIGASAGGLEAFEAFFSHMPRSTGMTFVIIQHLAPQHHSNLPELIQRYTKMTVKSAENDMAVEPDVVYVIPPNTLLALFNGKLQLLGPTENMGLRLPIDYFFRSLAANMKDRVVAIILSGTGSDGSLGIKAIKEAGGIVMVQEPATALYNGMPLSAITTGLVDFVLPVADIPDKLISYKRLAVSAKTDEISIQGKLTTEYLHQILLMVRTETGHDFSHYKETTIRRRIERLMAMNQIEHISEYVRFLQNNTIGIQVLFRDLLIGVTNFFRDKEAFASLQKLVIPHLFLNRRANQPIRIWVVGCSTGEEAYSIAILLREHMAALKQEFKVQLFATDIDDQAINFARAGQYSANIALDVPEAYLKQYFFETTDGYQVVKSLREMLIFAQHSVIKDPPFTKLDLISCRNMLIYMDSELQSKVFGYFRFALIHGGFLMLGSSESLGNYEAEFTTVDTPHRLYQSTYNALANRMRVDLPSAIKNLPAREIQRTGHPQLTLTVRDMLEMLLLNEWTPTCIIINYQGHLRYVHGQTGKYLEIASGSVDQLDIIRSARESLRTPLTTSIYRAVTQQREIFEPAIRLSLNDEDIYVNLTVKPLPDVIDNDNLLAVIFEDIKIPFSFDGTESESGSGLPDEHEQKYRLMQQELHDTREYLQATIEELKSTNEEMQSTNEEMQSTNEELETSQEELKAVNEELTTVNTELEQKFIELNAANDDLSNTFNSIKTGIILVDASQNIRRFNNAATELFKLIPTDVGRSINHIYSELNYSNLYQDAEQVFRSLIPHLVDLQTKSGEWYAVEIRPYRTVQNAIKGVVISFNNITLRTQTHAVQTARILAENVFDTVREPLLLIDANLQVVSANHAFFHLFQVTPEETLGRPLIQLGKDDWDIPALINLVESVIEKNTTFQDYELEHKFPKIGLKKFWINARQIRQLANLPVMALIAMQEMD